MFVHDNKQKDRINQVFEYKNGFALSSIHCSEGFSFKVPNLEGKEGLVFSLKGKIRVNGENLEEKDMLYVQMGSEIDVYSALESVVFIATNEASSRYNPYLKKYKDATRMPVGRETFRRSVIVMIGEKDHANRFIAGYVEDSLGEWSSYPPHKHDDKPEAYIFYGIDPAFAIQVVLDGMNETAYVVHDYDTVLIERGYHPHVNTSLKGSSYAWVISAPPENRNLGVEMHPSFKEINLGKSHLTINSKDQ